ncbi:glycerol-3-phosphate O-acyltransferase [Paracoccidioides lutzii Pb01]|uniref:Glycerol-3-phosphate O-acyltransferase n=1 Tax=Paracoccidioides lutzii (strain ATCC MYA-826 / Pb01) TaxID=502779 RepID=C1GUI2_PARBA|nr:glycerol-3-phosphate O-acyltransferase [Paracoccidioides lutzii Pb01]EEH39988.2 glycerol-3-phosphate O-acyltransferase [Paracoccidioides lutzii Pb01]
MSQSYMIPWLYDFGIWVFSLCLDIFFREIYSRGTWRIPRNGPVIVVAAPHANQFVDSAILMRNLRYYASRRTSFLTADKTMREPYIGTMTRLMGAVSVVRSMDLVKPAEGKIYIPDPENDPTLIRGQETDFTNGQFMEGGMIELRLQKPFKDFENGLPLHKPLREGTPLKVAPFVDQSQMFDAVYRKLCSGGCVGIFPEGGSHDRPSFLPLKAGVAIIALGTLARQPDCGLSIIPCGMNCFHPNKFRSRAVIEFGNPAQVHPDQIEAFKAGGHLKRNAVGSLLETIEEALAAVTQQSPDHETLMVIQATRRLYKPLRMRLPLPVIIELNRNLLKGYTQFKDEPKVSGITKSNGGMLSSGRGGWFSESYFAVLQRQALASSVVKLEGRDQLRLSGFITVVTRDITQTLFRGGLTSGIIFLILSRYVASRAAGIVFPSCGGGQHIWSRNYPDFESEKLVREDSHDDVYQSRLKSMPPSKSGSRSRSESRDSRSSSISSFLNDTLLRPLSTLSKDNLGEVNRRIQDSKSKKRIRRSRRDDVSDDDLVLVDEYSSVRSQHFTEDKKSR